ADVDTPVLVTPRPGTQAVHDHTEHRCAAQRDDQLAALALGALHRAIRPCTGHPVTPRIQEQFTHPLPGLTHQQHSLATRELSSRASPNIWSLATLIAEGGAWAPSFRTRPPWPGRRRSGDAERSTVMRAAAGRHPNRGAFRSHRGRPPGRYSR